MSQDDKRFLKMMQMQTHKNQQGNREMSMPFGLPPTLMPNKWPLSVNPLNGLLCTLNRKLKMKEDYFQFMGKVCECGHALPAPQDKLLTPYILKGKNHWDAPNWTRSRQQESAIRDAYGTYRTLGCIIPRNPIRSMWCSICQPSSKGSCSIRNSFLVLTLWIALLEC